MTEFFHVAPAGLQRGHVVEPWGWGRRLRQWRKGGQTFTNHQEAYVLVWEVALEAVRQDAAQGFLSK